MAQFYSPTPSRGTDNSSKRKCDANCHAYVTPRHLLFIQHTKSRKFNKSTQILKVTGCL